ncbi:MAG TPA: hypothetical protein VMZ02_02025, partial [Candidatus Limnocylindrales bacterium]|nr:hypothetical protein [Candidatus Limnocylindrales bacterium]
VGAAGEKVVPLEKFFILPSMDYRRENVLSPSEIVTEIFVPIPKPGSKGFHHKLRERLAWDHAIVAVDTVVESSSGVVRHASVVMGGVAPIPWRAVKAEEFLRGKRLDDAIAKQAGELALDGAKPLKDNIYKVKIAQDLIQRGLLASV